MKASELLEQVQNIIIKYGDIDVVKPYREEGWLYSEYEPISDASVTRKVICYEETGPYLLSID
mgnify:CR=1 FL=1|jgi:hypothetical protein